MRHSILIVDDNPDNLNLLRSVLGGEYNVFVADSVSYGRSLLKRERFSLALVDHHLPEMTGNEAIREFKQTAPEVQFLTITGDTSENVLQLSAQAGSLMVFDRRMGNETLRSVIRNYCHQFEDRHRLAEPEEVPANIREFLMSFNMIGRSQHLVDLCHLINKYARSNKPVAIQGENGTGKERVARALHMKSNVADGPFVAVNCGAIAESLIESELFGHVRGAFTGALKDRKGYFREADGGTIFLDEIGELPPHLQPKLLRVLQEGEIVPVGGDRPIKVDVRIISATNVDLEKATKSGKFREDLFHRLNVLPLKVSPLRERPEDIEPLIFHFEEKWRKANGAEPRRFRARTVAALISDPWTGNIRELESVIERVLTRTEGKYIEQEHLDERFQRALEGDESDVAESYVGLKSRHEREERDFLARVLKKLGSLSAAARALNLAKATLHGRIKTLGINT
jgi:two-component system, NtrC family, response regulator AtoC